MVNHSSLGKMFGNGALFKPNKGTNPEKEKDFGGGENWRKQDKKLEGKELK